MLTPNQEKYLQAIPEDKVIHIQPFNPKVRESAKEIISQIKGKLPDLGVFFGGASALGIAGQNDIDLNILSVPEEYDKHLPILKELFGEPTKTSFSLVEWEFKRNGFDVELYLTDRNSSALQEQIKTFEILRDNPGYRKKYEQIKLSSDSLSFREYMRRKYEFFSRLIQD
ncbi:MAG: hypothetical protein UX26_C0008G0008 [Parcubacteria group bacterium GW2011_GWC1_45_9]|uniref:Polymerase nucleotidyl transferase domain-containing protein n=1 Tax=Candidatus Woesebacteria bacterium GW2011_GWB1_44_11b TaxID=1618580 RepID=A0A0G1GGT9_9BACT|nr:MAG: hypothetical protein UW21_C0008G0010 [Candidatus Woesebacteria bacterium GW2011_GWB1_44_11b]KKU17082.1 MAG: hypothetical protein UX26_C0008G0008 [Parcubacteria group bacterium GW2011_GWC1_45_9]HCI05665.1 hypothetical protein [Patescibacteria group bacterium]